MLMLSRTWLSLAAVLALVSSAMPVSAAKGSTDPSESDPMSAAPGWIQRIDQALTAPLDQGGFGAERVDETSTNSLIYAHPIGDVGNDGDIDFLTREYLPTPDHDPTTEYSSTYILVFRDVATGEKFAELSFPPEVPAAHTVNTIQYRYAVVTDLNSDGISDVLLASVREDQMCCLVLRQSIAFAAVDGATASITWQQTFAGQTLMGINDPILQSGVPVNVQLESAEHLSRLVLQTLDSKALPSRSSSATFTTLILMTGEETASFAVPYVSAPPDLAGLGDLSGDGTADILTVHEISPGNRFAAYELDGTHLWSTSIRISNWSTSTGLIPLLDEHREDVVTWMANDDGEYSFGLDGTTGRILWEREDDFSWPYPAWVADVGGSSGRDLLVMDVTQDGIDATLLSGADMSVLHQRSYMMALEGTDIDSYPVGDIDGDDIEDFVIQSWTWFSPAPGSSSPLEQLFVAGATLEPILHLSETENYTIASEQDFDGDGSLDLYRDLETPSRRIAFIDAVNQQELGSVPLDDNTWFSNVRIGDYLPNGGREAFLVSHFEFHSSVILQDSSGNIVWQIDFPHQ